MGSTTKTDEHKEKIATVATRAARLLLRMKNSKEIMKQDSELYNARKQHNKGESLKTTQNGTDKKEKQRLSRFLATGIVGITLLASSFSVLQLKPVPLKNQTTIQNHSTFMLHSKKLNISPTLKYAAWNNGYISTTSMPNSPAVEGKVYLSVNPKSVKSVIWKNLYKYKNVTKVVGPLSVQLNFTVEVITNKGKVMYYWVQNVTGIKLSKKSKIMRYQEAEVFGLSKEGDSIGFGNMGKNMKGNGKIYCQAVQNGCTTQATYMYHTPLLPIKNQTLLTINETLKLSTGINKDGIAYIKFSARKEGESKSQNHPYDILHIGRKGKVKKIQVITNSTDPGQFGIGGGGEGADAFFPSNTQASLEILRQNNKGQTVKVTYNKSDWIVTQTGENSNLWVVRAKGDVVKFIPKGN